MGWKCFDCENTKSFTEINKVETLVTQERITTRIKKILNKYLNKHLIEVKCNNCNSANVKWVEVHNQTRNYLFQQDGFVTEDHKIQTLVFELTNECDISCQYCPKTGTNELNFSIIKRIIDENQELKRPIGHFEFGWDMGNPLLHSRMPDIIELFNKFQCNVNILTNGKNFLENISKLKLSNNFHFTFFLDHPDQEENDRLMGAGVFSGSLRAFEHLKNKRITFNVYMRLNRHNYNQIKEMENLAKTVGANLLTPTEIYPIGKANKDMIMDNDMKQEAIKDMEFLNLNKSIHFSPAILNANCTYQRNLRLLIDAQGRLSFCHFLSSLKNSNIIHVENKPLLEIIQINNKIRKSFLKNKEKLFNNWKKPRVTSSPCSYCLYSFGINEKW